jgi:hypothetical protein
MAKQPTIVSVTSGYMSATQITANDEALQAAFNNTLSLDGSTPNAMNASLDLNGNNLINGGVISGTSLLVGGVDLTTQVAAAAASAAAAAADVLLTAADVVTTNADAVLTAADVLLTAADVVTTNADAATTTQDAIDTAADLVATNQDTIDTAADVLLTAADVVTTNANAATTTQDAIDTAADAASTAADVVTVAATLDAFDDRYLGAKASDPTLDNDGNALLTGALYFNTSANEMRVYSGSAWLAAYVSAAGTLLVAQNLNDLNNADTALANLGGTTSGIAVFKGANAAAQRTSLGLGTAAVAATGDFATAAQGTLAGTSVQPTATQTLTNKTLTSPVINVTSDATGDLYYRTAAGLFERLPIGSTDDALKVVAGLPAWAGAAASPVKAWVNFNVSTGTPVIQGSLNVASITDLAVGRYRINFSADMANVNYSAVCSVNGFSSTQINHSSAIRHTGSNPNNGASYKLVGSFEILTADGSALRDTTDVNIIVTA